MLVNTYCYTTIKETQMDKFLTSNETQYRLARTIVQGVLGVIIANMDVIVGQCILEPQTRALIVALVMAVLSPIMAEIGKHIEPQEPADA